MMIRNLILSLFTMTSLGLTGCKTRENNDATPKIQLGDRRQLDLRASNGTVIEVGYNRDEKHLNNFGTITTSDYTVRVGFKQFTPNPTVVARIDVFCKSTRGNSHRLFEGFMTVSSTWTEASIAFHNSVSKLQDGRDNEKCENQLRISINGKNLGDSASNNDFFTLQDQKSHSAGAPVVARGFNCATYPSASGTSLTFVVMNFNNMQILDVISRQDAQNQQEAYSRQYRLHDGDHTTVNNNTWSWNDGAYAVLKITGSVPPFASITFNKQVDLPYSISFKPGTTISKMECRESSFFAFPRH